MAIFHFGYIDPGTGSILIQGIIGGFFGAAYIGRKFIGQAIGFAKNGFRGQGQTQKSDQKIEDSNQS